MTYSIYILVGINDTIKQFVVKLSQIVKESVQFLNWWLYNKTGFGAVYA